MLNIIFSNRYRELRLSLLSGLNPAQSSPFAADEIIVPSAAIRRDLELAIASAFGICANVRFYYLGSWIWHQLGKLTPIPADSPFVPDVLTWRILKIFDDRPFVQSQPRLAAYLDQADVTMRYELALRAATMFEQIVVYRPDWIEAWGANKFVCLPGGTRQTALDLRWQSALWRRILHEVGSERHLVASMERVAQLDAHAMPPSMQTNGTTHLFCPSAVAPLHIDILNKLGTWMDIRLYVQNPCREYWFDIVDRKRLSHLVAVGRAEHHETGNRLLASWGKQTQSMIDLLFERSGIASDEHSHFRANADGDKFTLLTQLQDAILNLNDLPPNSVDLAGDDRSIEIHVCHSLTRELEVLQDQLLALFAEDDSVQPSDVLVVTPNLEQAAPLVDAIFGTTTGARWIPYTITGRKHVRNNPVAAALIDLLSLASSRVTASAVHQLLQQPLVGQRFALDAASLETLHDWLMTSGIRWGLDAGHRERMGLPAIDNHSFDDGLNRLYLGYALPSDNHVLFDDRLPAYGAEGSVANALGSLNEFMLRLARLERAMSAQLSPAQWQSLLNETLDAFMLPTGNQIDDWREVRAQICSLCESMQKGSGDHAVPRAVLLHALTSVLDEPARGGVPSGSVTFTSMSSLRHLPYRIVCAIGLNDGAFPSTVQSPEFDLIAHSPRRGDRQRRDDERNLFLDLLLAAGDRFYLSYTGRSIRDNAPLTPSVLVDELLDYVTAAIYGEPDDVRQRLFVMHPLQPFSDQYFLSGHDHRLTSSNDVYHRALRAKLESPSTSPYDLPSDEEDDVDAEIPVTARPFFDPPRLPEPDESWRTLTLEQLIRFFRNPSRYLLRERLGILFPSVQDELHDDEPFLPDRDARQALADRLLPLCLQGIDETQLYRLATAGMEFPPGNLGHIQIREEIASLRDFAASLRDALSTPAVPPVMSTIALDLDGERWTCSGNLSGLRPTGLIGYRYHEAQATDYLEAWLSHLFLNAVKPDGVACQTTWFLRDRSFTLPQIDDARHELMRLIELYKTGLAHPLRFYPRSAWAFVDRGRRQEDAEKTWRNQNGQRGESRNPAYRQALRGVNTPLDDEFVACADLVFGRLSQLLKEGNA